MQNHIFGTIGLLVITQLLGPHDFHSMKRESVNGDQKLIAIIFQSIFFYVEKNKKKKNKKWTAVRGLAVPTTFTPSSALVK